MKLPAWVLSGLQRPLQHLEVKMRRNNIRKCRGSYEWNLHKVDSATLFRSMLKCHLLRSALSSYLFAHFYVCFSVLHINKLQILIFIYIFSHLHFICKISSMKIGSLFPFCSWLYSLHIEDYQPDVGCLIHIQIPIEWTNIF